MITEFLKSKDLNLSLEHYGEVVVVAATGAGKTSMLLDFFTNEEMSILYLSPLRALAEECFFRVENDVGARFTIRLNNQKSHGKFLEDLKKGKKRFAVATVESLADGFLEEIAKLKEKLVVVIDEIHLFFHWGNDFRPFLLEKYFEVKELRLRLLTLTATLSNDQKECYFLHEKLINENALIINLGNYELKTNPKKIHYFSPLQKKIIVKTFYRKLFHKKNQETIIVFVAFRNEVYEMTDRLVRLGFLALGCVSGEVDNFRNALKTCEQNQKNVDVIVSTTCLSHGVNLPKLSSVFLFYPIQHRDFWIQMIGRAGRRGEEFEVYEMNGYNEAGKPRKKIDLKIMCFKNQLRTGLIDIWH